MDVTTNQPLPPQEQTTAPDASPNAELARQMAIALNNGVEPSPEQQVQAEATTTTEPKPAVNGVDTFIKTFGWDNAEAAKQEIEQLRALRNAPAPAQIQYANDESKRLHEAIAAGKRDEVLSILNKQAQIERLVSTEVNKETAADIVKMGMQLKYKDLTPEEINYKFNKQFSIPSKPVQALDELDEEFTQRTNAWQEQANDKYMELMIEAKLAKPDIEQAKSKIELPAIQAQVDEQYLQWKQAQEQDSATDAQTVEAYRAFTPKSIETKVPYIDEANKINFEFQFEPDADSFKNTVDMVSDLSKFYGQFQNSDGSPNREKFLRAIYVASNYEKIISEAIKQGGNARFKSILPNNESGGSRMMPQAQELSELDKQMRQSLHGYI